MTAGFPGAEAVVERQGQDAKQAESQRHPEEMPAVGVRCLRGVVAAPVLGLAGLAVQTCAGARSGEWHAVPTPFPPRGREAER